MKYCNSDGKIVLELLLSLVICTLMISTFTTGMVELNSKLELRREQFRMETILMKHVLEYERHESVLNEDNLVTLEGYTLHLIGDELCVSWEGLDEQAKELCSKVYIEMWFYAL